MIHATSTCPLFNPMAITDKKKLMAPDRKTDPNIYTLYRWKKKEEENIRMIEIKRWKTERKDGYTGGAKWDEIQLRLVIVSSEKDEARTCKRTSSGINFK